MRLYNGRAMRVVVTGGTGFLGRPLVATDCGPPVTT